MRDLISLFHGTTARAAAIVQDGWTKQALGDVVADVATQHGCTAEDLWGVLDTGVQTYVHQTERGEWASFARRFDVAAHSWAQ